MLSLWRVCRVIIHASFLGLYQFMARINANNTPFFLKCVPVGNWIIWSLSSRTQSRVRKYCPRAHRLTELRKRSHTQEVLRGRRLPSVTSHLRKDRAFSCSRLHRDFPRGSEGKASACSAGCLGSVPGSGRSPGEGNGTPLQYSFLEDPMDGGAC